MHASSLPVELDGYRVEVLSRERVPAMARLVAHCFSRFEPIARCLDLGEAELERFFTDVAAAVVDQQLSLVVIEVETDRLVAGFILHDLVVPLDLPPPPPAMAPLLAMMDGVVAEYLALYPDAQPGQIADGLAAGVDPSLRARGIMAAALPLMQVNAVARGYRREMTIATSPVTCHILEQCTAGRVRRIFERRYDAFEFEGRAVFADIGDRVPATHGWRDGGAPTFALIERDYLGDADPEPAAAVTAGYRALLGEIKGRKLHMLGKPGNMGFDFSPLADALAVFMNNSGDPIAASSHRLGTKELERRVIDFFGAAYGLPPGEGFGYIGNGGTEALEFGLLQGSRSAPDAITLLSDQCHYSALTILEKYQRRYAVVRSQPHGEIDYDALRAAADANPGPVIALATLGTTMKGASDRPAEIRRVLGDRPVYIHCDAALNGAFLPFLPPGLGAPAVDLVTLADSISISLHKFLGNPTPAGLVLTRDEPRFSLRYIDYIASPSTTLSCSRSGLAALCAAYRIDTLGARGIALQALRCIALARYLAARLDARGVANLLNPASNIVSFAAPAREVCEKWMLPVTAGMTHAVVMPHVTREGLDEFLADLG